MIGAGEVLAWRQESSPARLWFQRIFGPRPKTPFPYPDVSSSAAKHGEEEVAGEPGRVSVQGGTCLRPCGGVQRLGHHAVLVMLPARRGIDEPAPAGGVVVDPDGAAGRQA